MRASPASEGCVHSRVLRRMRKTQAFLKARRSAETRSVSAGRTRRLVKEMVDSTAKSTPEGRVDGQSTPEARMDAAKARAAAVYAKVEDIVAQADLQAAQAEPAAATLNEARIDDLGTMFANRNQLPGWLRERIETIYAKVNWKKSNGKPDYFNVAVHKNHIPIDKALTILAHLEGIQYGTGLELPGWVDAVIECGLFSKIRRGKFEYQHRCQDSEHCELCNYLNISDGLKTLYAGYSPTAFNRGGNWFAVHRRAATSPATPRPLAAP